MADKCHRQRVVRGDEQDAEATEGSNRIIPRDTKNSNQSPRHGQPSHVIATKQDSVATSQFSEDHCTPAN